MRLGKLHIIASLLLAISLNCCTCLSNNNTVQNQTVKEVQPLPGISLPPGSAVIDAQMQGYSKVAGGFVCKMKISEVNGYGPATPPLPKGYVITIDVPGSLLEKNKYDAGKIFAAGNLLKMSVRYLRAVPGDDSSDKWIATGFDDLTK